MQIHEIKALVARLGAIVDGWDEKSGAPAVERHIAASLLAELYEAVKFDTALAATEIVTPTAEPVAEPAAEEESVPEVIDLSDIFGGSSVDDDEPSEEVAEVAPEVEPEVEDAPEVTPEVEPAPEVEPTPEVEEVTEEPTPVVEEVAESVEEESVPEEVEPTPEPEPVAEPEPTPEPEPEPEVVEETPAEQPGEKTEEQAEKIEEKPAEKPSTQAALFDMEVVRRPRSSSGRRVIMSLYGESPATTRREKKQREKVAEPANEPANEPTVEPANETPQMTVAPAVESITPPTPEVEPQSECVAAVSVAERIAVAQTESPQVLGDVIGAGTTTLAEAVAASQPTVPTVQNDRVNSLRNSIGINDRFIMIRDLFGGDGAAFDRAMEDLDAFDDFNECLVYMSEFRWNPNSDGARMLMDLVTRKLL